MGRSDGSGSGRTSSSPFDRSHLPIVEESFLVLAPFLVRGKRESYPVSISVRRKKYVRPKTLFRLENRAKRDTLGFVLDAHASTGFVGKLIYSFIREPSECWSRSEYFPSSTTSTHARFRRPPFSLMLSAITPARSNSIRHLGACRKSSDWKSSLSTDELMKVSRSPFQA